MLILFLWLLFTTPSNQVGYHALFFFFYDNHGHIHVQLFLVKVVDDDTIIQGEFRQPYIRSKTDFSIDCCQRMHNFIVTSFPPTNCLYDWPVRINNLWGKTRYDHEIAHFLAVVYTKICLALNVWRLELTLYIINQFRS